MDTFTLKDLPKINEVGHDWIAVERWAESELARFREKREDPDADQRKLDIALGSILALKMLLRLPEAIRKEHEKDPVEKSGFGIPPLDPL